MPNKGKIIDAIFLVHDDKVRSIFGRNRILVE